MEIKKVIKEVRRLASENPDYVYTNNKDENGRTICLYLASADQPGCIFGQALTRLGVVIPIDLEGRSIDFIFWRIGRIELPGADSALVDWCSEVQRGQDSGLAWAKAIHGADVSCPGVVTSNSGE
jgi:hypothetical protein